MLSNHNTKTFFLERREEVVLLTELRSLLLLAQQNGCKDLEVDYPKVCELQKILDVLHGMP